MRYGAAPISNLRLWIDQSAIWDKGLRQSATCNTMLRQSATCDRIHTSDILQKGYTTSMMLGLGSDLIPQMSTAGIIPHLNTGLANANTCTT